MLFDHYPNFSIYLMGKLHHFASFLITGENMKPTKNSILLSFDPTLSL